MQKGHFLASLPNVLLSFNLTQLHSQQDETATQRKVGSNKSFSFGTQSHTDTEPDNWLSENRQWICAPTNVCTNQSGCVHQPKWRCAVARKDFNWRAAAAAAADTI